MPWRMALTRPAEKDLADMPRSDRETILTGLRRLLDDPSTADLRKLGGRVGEWRLRVGRWRALLFLDSPEGIVRVLRILPRGSAYQE